MFVVLCGLAPACQVHVAVQCGAGLAALAADLPLGVVVVGGRYCIRTSIDKARHVPGARRVGR